MRLKSRLRGVSIATLIMILAAGSARAEPQPPPPPPSGPVAMPYPDPQPLPPEPCTHTICLPKPGATREGVAAHKHIAGVKYEDFATSSATMEPATVQLSESPDAQSQPLQVVGLSWGKLAGAGPVYSADPMEGGQIAREAARPAVSEMNVTKLSDQSSANLAERRARPGRPTFGNLVDEAPVMVAEPVARGTATFKTLAGLCATGKHLVKVKITTRTGSYALHDATVISVIPADVVDGQAMEQVTLSYASLDN